MNNKDFTYLVILIIIVLSSIISQKKEINSYVEHPIFDIVMLLNIIILSKYNIYIAVFVTYSYLLIKIKSVN
tara:strand:- start:200 stop:415 length:216 start_codon:yes stop_codon:yes gene_type:complete